MVEQKSGNRYDKLMYYCQVKPGIISPEGEISLSQRPSTVQYMGNEIEKDIRNTLHSFMIMPGVDPKDADVYKLLINTVGYVYCIDPTTKTIKWILDKSYYHRIADPFENTASARMSSINASQAYSHSAWGSRKFVSNLEQPEGPCHLDFYFQDARDSIGKRERVVFYSKQDKKNFQESLIDENN